MSIELFPYLSYWSVLGYTFLLEKGVHCKLRFHNVHLWWDGVGTSIMLTLPRGGGGEGMGVSFEVDGVEKL